MSQTPTVYSNMISARSRRLRTIGILLLVAIVAMTAYGYFGLMPAIDRSLRENRSAVSQREGAPQSGTIAAPGEPLTRAQRVQKLKVAVALAYWGVCALLLLGVVVVAWLDLREVSRTYMAQRRAIWTETAERLAHKDDSP